MKGHDDGRVVVIEPGQGGDDVILAEAAVGIEPERRKAEGAIVQLSNRLRSTAALAEDIHGAARMYPPDDLDPDAVISEITMEATGALVAFAQTDQVGFKLAISTALKRVYQTRDYHRFDQTAMGRQSKALDAIAGARDGYRPSSFAYRLEYATWMDRLKTWGHDDDIESKIWRWFRPGPANVAVDVSYWFIHRSCWVCWRPVNGRLESASHPEMPTDCDPHETMGDEWHSYTGLPQIRIAERGRCAVKTDVDLLFTNLGFRSWRSLMFGEWIELAKGASIEVKVQDTRDINADDAGKVGKLIKNFLFWACAFAAVIASPFVIPLVIGWF